VGDVTGRNILVIEDEPSIADNVVFALKSEGFAVTWRSLSKDGVAFLAQERVDLVILDVGLPDGSGFERCKEIRSASDVPILFLTARADEIDRVVGFEIGADDYVTKPFSPREMVARVKSILRRTRSEPVAAGEPRATNAFAVDDGAICSAPVWLRPAARKSLGDCRTSSPSSSSRSFRKLRQMRRSPKLDRYLVALPEFSCGRANPLWSNSSASFRVLRLQDSNTPGDHRERTPPTNRWAQARRNQTLSASH
jgi:DNA-binding response OmpR family regulator